MGLIQDFFTEMFLTCKSFIDSTNNHETIPVGKFRQEPPLTVKQKKKQKNKQCEAYSEQIRKAKNDVILKCSNLVQAENDYNNMLADKEYVEPSYIHYITTRYKGANEAWRASLTHLGQLEYKRKLLEDTKV